MIRRFDGNNSKGIDISAAAGTPVIAAAAGTVVYAGNGLRGYGNLLIIKHNAEYLTAYAHNRALMVKEGQSVTRGEKIAEMGDTDTDRVMLHFELRYQGRSIDPSRSLPPDKRAIGHAICNRGQGTRRALKTPNPTQGVASGHVLLRYL